MNLNSVSSFFDQTTIPLFMCTDPAFFLASITSLAKFAIARHLSSRPHITQKTLSGASIHIEVAIVSSKHKREFSSTCVVGEEDTDSSLYDPQSLDPSIEHFGITGFNCNWHASQIMIDQNF